jgi:hypothetical protein
MFVFVSTNSWKYAMRLDGMTKRHAARPSLSNRSPVRQIHKQVDRSLFLLISSDNKFRLQLTLLRSVNIGLASRDNFCPFFCRIVATVMQNNV